MVASAMNQSCRAAGSDAGASKPGHAAHQGTEVAAEIDQDRSERADVARHVKWQPELLGIPAEKRAGENQMRRARHRQELGQSLHDAEQRRFEQQSHARPASGDAHVAAALARPLGHGLFHRHGGTPAGALRPLRMIAMAAAMKTVE